MRSPPREGRSTLKTGYILIRRAFALKVRPPINKRPKGKNFKAWIENREAICFVRVQRTMLQYICNQTYSLVNIKYNYSDNKKVTVFAKGHCKHWA